MLKKTSFYYIIHSPGPKTSMESDVKDELTRDRVARPVARLSKVFQFIWWTSEKSCSAPCMMEMYGYTTALSNVLRFSGACFHGALSIGFRLLALRISPGCRDAFVVPDQDRSISYDRQVSEN